DFAYGLPSALLYEYQLEGVDKDWKLLAAQNEVSYYGLSSGTYTFRVRLPGNEQSEAVYQVTVRPMIPWWGWALSILLIIGIVAFIRYYVWKRMRRLLPSPAQVVSTPAENISRKEQVTEQPETITEQPETIAEQPEVISEQPSVATEEKYKTNRLTEEECKELHKKLVTYVEKEKPYINPDLKMGDLASALDISSHSLSYLLNQYLNQSYYDFINEYRVTQFKKMVADSQYSRYTLTALAELCGFSSRASFFRSFKKSTGVTPNEYIRSIGGTAKEE
ncbi:helix-turn-helix domain-containing protein, partial [Phocaeicola sartorii]